MNSNVAENGKRSDFEMVEQIGTGGFGVVIAIAVKPYRLLFRPGCYSDFKNEIIDWFHKGFGQISRIDSNTSWRNYYKLAKHIINRQLYALKLIEKKLTVLKSQVAHVKNEIKLLSCTDFEFLIKLEYFFKDNVYLYLGMPFIYGGEMTTHLHMCKRFDEKLSKFYVAQVVLSLEYLHFMGIVYRDLKPENICIDIDGYIKLCDFGFSKKIDQNRTYSFCGTPDYLAPEVILHIGYSYSVDFWTLGVFLFEINAGFPPFSDELAVNQYEKIVAGKFQCPTFFSKELVDLTQKLIVVERSTRFGCLKKGYSDIKLHDWFDDLDWSSLIAKKIKPHFIPRVDKTQINANFVKQSEMDIRNGSIDEYSHIFIDFN